MLKENPVVESNSNSTYVLLDNSTLNTVNFPVLHYLPDDSTSFLAWNKRKNQTKYCMT